jgi:hypothetical protein
MYQPSSIIRDYKSIIFDAQIFPPN